MANLLKSRLETRLKKLKELALQDIVKLTEDLARQDKRQAAKVKGKLEARLDATCAFFDGLPPQKYDRNISERITEIQPQQAPPADCEWLSTPVRASLERGTAQLAVTVRREVQFEEANLPEPVPELRVAAPAPATAKPQEGPRA